MLTQLIALIQTNLTYPVASVVYGYNDAFQSGGPYISIQNYNTEPEFDTGGIRFIIHTWEIHIYTDSFTTAETLDTALASVINGDDLTTGIMYLFWLGTSIQQDEGINNRTHFVQSYKAYVNYTS